MISAAAILAGVSSRRAQFDINSIAFDQQLKFISDPARLKALFCTRRAAKSFTIGLYLINTALQNPNSNCLYLGLTRDSAKGIIWKDILRELDQRFKLNASFNGTALTMTLPNGSVIWTTGADADEAEMNKLLGKKYKLVGIDEASMYSINMNQLVYGILKPATADQRGTICMLGTASNITRGLFYDVTTGREPGWSLHSWSAHQNPHIATQWQEELDDITKNRPLFTQTPLFRQWYLNEWVVDEDALVYKFSERNLINHLAHYDVPYRYILGIDLGHSPDPSAFVIGAYTPISPILRIIHAEKHLKMDVTDVANKIKELDAKFSFDVRVIDGSNKMAVEEMNNRHQVRVIAADKTGKEHFINLMNTEFIQGKIQVLMNCPELIEEYKTLVWETDNGKVKVSATGARREHPGIPNHLTDAALYMWRYAYTYLYTAPKDPIDFNSQARWENEHIKRLEDQVRKEQNPNTWETEFQADNNLFNFDEDPAL